MVWHPLRLVVLGLSTLGGGLPPSGIRAEDPDRIAALVQQLGHAEFAKREAASRALAGLDAALPALKKAAASPDPETRRRAEELVQGLERQRETARLLQPRLVNLRLKDKTLKEAVDAFAKETNFPLQLANELTGRRATRLTLEIENMPFWDAFHLFCQKTGLVENALVPSRQAATDAARVQAVVEMRLALQQQGRVVVMSGGVYEHQVQPCLLVPGKLPDVPTCQVGPLRVRALPPSVHPAGYSRSGDEIQLSLEVSPDPRLAWGNFGNVRIQKAVDERGQLLTQSLKVPQSAAGTNDLEELLIISDVMNETELFGNGSRHVPIRLFLDRLPSKRLKELTGTLSAQVRTPPEPFIVVDQVLQARGKTWTGPEGSSLKVVDLKRNEDGRVELNLEVQEPGMSATNMVFRGRGGRVRFGRWPRTTSSAPANLTLFDTDGKPLPLSAGQWDGQLVRKEDELIQQYHVVFPARTGQGEPAKLVLTGQRTVAIQVPFKLENVPLP